ncbi:Alanine dehydrogenase [Streptomyces sp. RB17]|nr:Alanine dehydrogenase [Streptomyces sp. RB17]
MTRVLTRSDLEAVLEPAECLTALRDGFRRADATAVPGRLVRTDLPFPGTATALIPGLLPGVEAYTVKVDAKFPAARPALRGVIRLHGGADGELLALLDSATVTAWRTGLAAALGTALLAPAGHEVLGVIGAGAQAELTLRGLASERPPGRLVVHDTDSGRAAPFAARHGGRVLDSARAVAEAADTVLLATWSRAPLLALADTRAGQHVTSLGTATSPVSGNSPRTCWRPRSWSSTTPNSPRRWARWPRPASPVPPPTPPSRTSCAARIPAVPRSGRARCTHRSDCPGRTSPSPGSPGGRRNAGAWARRSTCCSEPRCRAGRHPRAHAGSRAGPQPPARHLGHASLVAPTGHHRAVILTGSRR